MMKKKVFYLDNYDHLLQKITKKIDPKFIHMNFFFW